MGDLEALAEAIVTQDNKFGFLPKIKEALLDVDVSLQTLQAGLPATDPNLRIMFAKIQFASGVPTRIDELNNPILSVAMNVNTLEITSSGTGTPVVLVSANLPFNYKWEVAATATAGKHLLTLHTWTVVASPGKSQVVAASIPNHILDVVIGF